MNQDRIYSNLHRATMNQESIFSRPDTKVHVIIHNMIIFLEIILIKLLQFSLQFFFRL